MSYVVDQTIRFGTAWLSRDNSAYAVYDGYNGVVNQNQRPSIGGTYDAGFEFRATSDNDNYRLWWNLMSNGYLICRNLFESSGANDIREFKCPSSVTYGGAQYTCRFFTVGKSGSDVQNIYPKLSASAFTGSKMVYIDPKHYKVNNGNGGISQRGNFEWSTSGNIVTENPDYHYTKESVDYTPVILIPAGNVAEITIDQASVGTITNPDGITATCTQTCEASLYVDESYYGKFNMTANVSTTVPLSLAWSKISKNEPHTLTLKTSLNNYMCEDKRTFTKKEAALSVSGVAMPVDKMPVACTMLSIIDHAPGEVATMEVCNNAMDSAPFWEEYTGDEHAFENKTKTADRWGVNWRYMVDASNASGSTKPGIKTKVGMGVVYAESD